MEKHEKLPLDINTLLDTFNIEVVENNEALDTWLNATDVLTVSQSELLTAVQKSLLKQGDEWNESGRRSGRTES